MTIDALLPKTAVGWVSLALFATVAAASTREDQLPFELNGQVLLVNGAPSQLVLIYDGLTSTPVINDAKPSQTCKVGDFVSVFGHENRSRNSNAHQRLADRIVIRGNGPLPPAKEVSGAEVVRGTHLMCPIAVRGVICAAAQDEMDPQWNWLLLNTETAKVRIAAPKCAYPLSLLSDLIDAEVVLSGIVNRLQPWHGASESHLIVCGTNSIAIVQKPPANPRAAPPLSDGNSLHRRSLEGSLVATTANGAFILDDNERLVSAVLHKTNETPPVGSRVSVVGFAELGHGFLSMTEAFVFPTGRSAATFATVAEAAPENASFGRNGHLNANFDLYGKIVRVQGRVVQASAETGEILVRCDNCIVRIDASSSANVRSMDILPDALVEVTGLCIADFEPTPRHAIFPAFRGFALVPRSSADVRVLRSPRWWTPSRLLMAIFALVALIVVILVWNYQLKVQSERRGQRLAREKLAHLRAKAKTEERTRLAIELHDSISQTLTGISFHVESALGACDGRLPNVELFLNMSRQMLISCRKELQGCLWDLRTRTFEEKNMTEAVQRTIKPHLGQAEASVRFNVPRAALSDTVAHTILRIIRELVSNAILHGKAKKIAIAGERHDSVVCFSVRDNGCGFDPHTSDGPSTGHFGLEGVRERLNALEGNLTIESRPGQGSKLTVTLTLPS